VVLKSSQIRGSCLDRRFAEILSRSVGLDSGAGLAVNSFLTAMGGVMARRLATVLERFNIAEVIPWPGVKGQVNMFTREAA